MAVSNTLIVVIQNEPRDGDMYYLMESEEAFNQRLVELGMVPSGETDFEWSLGWTYDNEDDFCSVTGHEVQLPWAVHNLCNDCFDSGHRDAPDHEVGTHMVINFVAEADCESCREQLVDCKSCFKEHTVGDGCKE